MLNRHARRCVYGASLIEVLVAMLLLSFGLLALAGWHARSLQYSRGAQYRAVAAQLALDLSERMRANGPGVAADAYNRLLPYAPAEVPQPVPVCGDPLRCTPAEMAARDIAQWLNTARTSLPGAGLVARRDSLQGQVMDLWVLWLPPRTPDALDPATSLRGRCPAEAGAAPPELQCLLMRVSP